MDTFYSSCICVYCGVCGSSILLKIIKVSLRKDHSCPIYRVRQVFTELCSPFPLTKPPKNNTNPSPNVLTLKDVHGFLILEPQRIFELVYTPSSPFPSTLKILARYQSVLFIFDLNLRYTTLCYLTITIIMTEPLKIVERNFQKSKVKLTSRGLRLKRDCT